MSAEPEAVQQLRANVAYFDRLFGERPTGATTAFFSVEAQREILRWIDARAVDQVAA